MRAANTNNLSEQALRVIARARQAATEDGQETDTAYLLWALVAERHGPHHDLMGQILDMPWSLRRTLRQAASVNPEQQSRK